MPREPLSVSTGGHPVEAVSSALIKVVKPGRSYRVTVAHDDGCPAVAGAGLIACTRPVLDLVARAAR